MFLNCARLSNHIDLFQPFPSLFRPDRILKSLDNRRINSGQSETRNTEHLI